MDRDKQNCVADPHLKLIPQQPLNLIRVQTGAKFQVFAQKLHDLVSTMPLSQRRGSYVALLPIDLLRLLPKIDLFGQ